MRSSTCLKTVRNLALLALAATMGPTNMRAAPAQKTLGKNGEAKVTVTHEASGPVVKAQKNDIVTVRLASNATTGFQWHLVRSDARLAALGKSTYESEQTDKSEPPRVGAGGTQIFRFTALKTGKSQLEFHYSRSWEKGVKPAGVYKLTVIVE